MNAQKISQYLKEKCKLLSALLLISLSLNISAQSIQPSLDCTEGIIVINGTIVGSGMWCTWVYTPITTNEVLNDPDEMPPGALLVSAACNAHLDQRQNLPASCRHFDPGSINQMDWNSHFLTGMKAMLCQVTPCSNPARNIGAFTSNGDGLALLITRSAGTAYWNTLNSHSIANATLPHIHNHCRSLPEHSFYAYDQQRCYSDALQVMRELSPAAYSAGISFLNSLNILGFSLNLNGSVTNYGEEFLTKLSDFRRCSRWHVQFRQKCPS